MPPDSVQAAVIVGVAAFVLAVLTAVLWDRWGRGWRWPMRVVGVVLGAVMALAAAGVAVNRVMELYTSWSEVFGSRPASAAEDVRAAIQSTAKKRTGSQVVSFTVAGHASGIRLTAYAYLPAGYNSGMRYPVVEALDGYPGSPLSWLHRLRVRSVLDQEIGAGRMAPTVVVFPYQTPSPLHDTECVDAVRGTRADTFLTVDVRSEVTRLFRVRADRAGWGLIGYSTGGFCAANLGLRHADWYAAAASLSGYFQPFTNATTGDLYRGNATVRDENSPLWRMTHLAQPDLALYLACARDDGNAYSNIKQMLAVTRTPALITTAIVPRGGHTPTAWRPLEAPAFDWLSSRLAAPEIVVTGGPPSQAAKSPNVRVGFGPRVPARRG